ncbi:MAG: glycosyltransferase [Clostridium sp.]
MKELCEKSAGVGKFLKEKNSKKISIACLHLDHGGIEMAVTSLANALCEEGYQVELLCTYRLCNPVYQLDPRVIVTYLTDCKPNRQEIADAWNSHHFFILAKELFRAGFILWRKKRTMIEAIRRVQEGILISTRDEYTLLLSRFGNPHVRKIAQIHQSPQFSPRKLRRMRKGYRNIDVLVTPTRQAANELRKNLSPFIPNLSCVAIPHFLAYEKGRAGTKKRKQIIAVGRLHPEKGFARMLQLWSKVIPCFPDVILKIVGDGGERGNLEEKCKNLGIKNTVIFTGVLPHEQVLDEMEHSLCYLMTSLEESFGFVLIEALSCGLPVLAYDVQMGPREIVEDGVNGFLVPDGDENLMADRLRLLLSKEKLRRRLGEGAKQSSFRYEKTAIIQKWIQCIKGEDVAD